MGRNTRRGTLVWANGAPAGSESEAPSGQLEGASPVTDRRVGSAERVSQGRLPPWSRVHVVVAHPDDESFGLGAVIDAFVRAGAVVQVLCLTRGESSTLGAQESDLSARRRAERDRYTA